MAVALRRASVAASLLATLLATLVAQQPPTIHVPVRLVAVPTLVLSQQGRVIDGLNQSNFHLYDNQRLQNVKLELGRSRFLSCSPFRLTTTFASIFPSLPR